MTSCVGPTARRKVPIVRSVVVLPVAALVLAAPLAGCGSTDGTTTPTSIVEALTLPIGATLTMEGTRIDLEVARTPAEQQTGLMGRTDLPADRGMLFPTSRPIGMSMWMANTPIPLDIVFLRDGIVTRVVDSAPPCTSSPCPIWSSDGPVDAVLELRGGRAAELGIVPGRPLEITYR